MSFRLSMSQTFAPYLRHSGESRNLHPCDTPKSLETPGLRRVTTFAQASPLQEQNCSFLKRRLERQKGDRKSQLMQLRTICKDNPKILSFRC